MHAYVWESPACVCVYVCVLIFISPFSFFFFLTHILAAQKVWAERRDGWLKGQ